MSWDDAGIAGCPNLTQPKRAACRRAHAALPQQLSLWQHYTTSVKQRKQGMKKLPAASSSAVHTIQVNHCCCIAMTATPHS